MNNTNTSTEKFDTLNFIMAYEGGEIDNDDDLIEGFQHLVDNGMAWQLQGHYGRTAAALIAAGKVIDHRARRRLH